MNKPLVIGALALGGMYLFWRHMSTPKPIVVPVGAATRPRMTNDPRIFPTSMRDLIGCMSYGFTGDGAVTPQDTLFGAGETTDQNAIDWSAYDPVGYSASPTVQ